MWSIWSKVIIRVQSNWKAANPRISLKKLFYYFMICLRESDMCRKPIEILIEATLLLSLQAQNND